MSKQRDPWFDNAKMTLVTLIVVGHSWVMIPEHDTRDWLYDFLYYWHIPAFVLITGHRREGERASGARGRPVLERSGR